ncbi:hypothetical protein EDB80DRAFT_878760 [Ilyonectria destructans]|nr:hypothetical protein EDB80DRAFT_878760 [Ilyonectria destructans]
MDLFEQPGEAPTRSDVDEAWYYYYGIYGTLTARTSTHKFTSDYYFPKEKRFLPISQHMIPSAGNDQLILELQTALIFSSFFVGKYGATTALTFGMTNEIKTIFRAPSMGRKLIVWELTVISCQRSEKKPFSQPGGSGAAVFDLEGRVVSLLNGDDEHRTRLPTHRCCKHHSGTKSDPSMDDLSTGFQLYEKGTDLTFVSPINAVFDDIELFTKSKSSLV